MTDKYRTLILCHEGNGVTQCVFDHPYENSLSDIDASLFDITFDKVNAENKTKIFTVTDLPILNSVGLGDIVTIIKKVNGEIIISSTNRKSSESYIGLEKNDER